MLYIYATYMLYIMFIDKFSIIWKFWLSNVGLVPVTSDNQGSTALFIVIHANTLPSVCALKNNDTLTSLLWI